MKRFGAMILTFIFLAGCGAKAQVPRETVGSCMEAAASGALPRYTLSIPVPEEAGGDWGGEDMTVFCQTLRAADLDELLREVTGREDRAVLLSKQEGLPRYDLTWTACSDAGEEIWRCAVIDDGAFYYVACAGFPAEAAQETRQQIEACFAHLQLQEAMGIPA